MRLSRPIATATSLFAVAAVAQAQQVNFNEIFASHTGTDDQEYIELVGTPGMSLNGYMVCIIEGEGIPAGILDRAWDLTGHSIPNDGFFLMSDIAVPGLDYDLGQGPGNNGPDNNIENGTQTYYLLTTNSVAFVQSLHNTDTDANDDCITDLATDSSTTVLEVIGVFDEDPTGDQIFDGAQVIGPDLSGPFLPPGMFRPSDYPNAWCTDVYQDFFLSGLTPGMPNPGGPCDQSVTIPQCSPQGTFIGTNYCGPAVANSSGNGATIEAFGNPTASVNFLELTANDMPQNQFGYFLASQTQGFFNPPASQGNICLMGNIARFNGQIQNTGTAGSIMITVDTQNIPLTPSVAIMAGETWNFTCWFRDLNPTNTSNFSDGIEITFQ